MRRIIRTLLVDVRGARVHRYPLWTFGELAYVENGVPRKVQGRTEIQDGGLREPQGRTEIQDGGPRGVQGRTEIQDGGLRGLRGELK